MKTKNSHRILKRNKKYDYKIWEEKSYNKINENTTIYYVTDYNEKEIMFKDNSFSAVQDYIDELESQIDNYAYGGIEKEW